MGRCRIRLFAIKEEPHSEYGDGFEVLNHTLFHDGLYSTPPMANLSGKPFKILEPKAEDYQKLSAEEWIADEIDNIGYDGIAADIEKILAPYSVDDIVEILGTYCIEGHYTSSWDGDDYYQESYLEDTQHNKLNDFEITKFIGAFKRGDDGLIEFLNEDTSLNHGIAVYSDKGE
jgi:hypothetical protein